MGTYAFGDVHGRLDLLTRALDMIEADAGQQPATIIALGDYVDRGPDSAGVVALLMAGARRAGDTLICLKGNHEDLMIGSAKGDPAALNCWIGNGGSKTLASYGDPVSPAHIDWMDALPVMHSDAHRVYVHAGLMPGHGIDEQLDEWCLWIRDRFLRASNEWGKHVVHGHTPQHDGKPDPEKPELLAGRTNLDTGAYATGVLTVGVFDDAKPGGPVRILTADERDLRRVAA